MIRLMIVYNNSDNNDPARAAPKVGGARATHQPIEQTDDQTSAQAAIRAPPGTCISPTHAHAVTVLTCVHSISLTWHHSEGGKIRLETLIELKIVNLRCSSSSSC